ncbi:hypothetical protein KR032_002990 [Drosophila birchii]|nr:hypothetical protein KR032_002990 [Drosophila birchii]
MPLLQILVLSLILFVGSSNAVISELARQGESAIQGLADIKLAPLRYLDAIVGTNPGGLGFYGGAGGAVSAAAALQAANQLGLRGRLGLGPSITTVGQGDDLMTIIQNSGPFNPLGIPRPPYPGYPHWPRPALGHPNFPRLPGGPGSPGGPGGPGILGLRFPRFPGLRIPLPSVSIGAGTSVGTGSGPAHRPGVPPNAVGGGPLNYGGLFGTGLFGHSGLFGSGILPGWLLDPLGIFTPLGNLFGGLGNLFGLTSNVAVNRAGLFDRNVQGSISVDLGGSIPTPKTFLRQLISPVLNWLG